MKKVLCIFTIAWTLHNPAHPMHYEADVTMPDCCHTRCDACGLYTQDHRFAAQNKFQLPWMCPFHQSNVSQNSQDLFTYIKTHLSDSFSHFTNCAHEDPQTTDRVLISSFEECIKFDHLIEFDKSGDIIYNTLLHEAAKSGNLMMLDLILYIFSQHHIKIDITAKSYNNGSALHVAAFFGNSDCVSELLIRQASPNILDGSGYTPLHLAWIEKKWAVVKQLVTVADVSVVTREQNTYLHFAAMFDSNQQILKLLARQIDPNIQNKDGNTALHIATINNFHSCVKALLRDPRTNRNIRNKSGHTAYDIAEITGNKIILKLLSK